MSQKSVKRGQEAPRPGVSPLGVVSALVVVAIFVGLGLMLAGQGAQPQAAAPTALPFAEATPAAAAGDVAPPADVAARNDMYSAAPPMTIDAAKQYTATITTPRGDIVIRLRPDIAPQTVNSFVFLAREGFYDGVTWHRVLPNFMAQGGDPTGTGMGGPGYTIPGEFTDQFRFDRPGLVAMARPGNDVNGNGSQFFITTAPAPYLFNEQTGKTDYTVFGEVIEGQEIVDGIPLRDPDTNPATPGEQMLSIAISEGP